MDLDQGARNMARGRRSDALTRRARHSKAGAAARPQIQTHALDTNGDHLPAHRGRASLRNQVSMQPSNPDDLTVGDENEEANTAFIADDLTPIP